MKAALTIIQFLIVFPIRFYLLWYVLKAVNATELPMFLFWASIPLILLMVIIGEAIEKDN